MNEKTTSFKNLSTINKKYENIEGKLTLTNNGLIRLNKNDKLELRIKTNSINSKIKIKYFNISILKIAL
jgi:hypothetical protein